jgi:hypothetical protein
MNRLWTCALVVAIASLTAAPPAAAAQDFSIAGPPARDVRLLERMGAVSLVVTNESRRSLRPVVRFLARDGSQVSTLTVANAVDRAELDVEGPVNALAPFDPGESRQLDLTLYVQPSDGPEALDGRLEIVSAHRPDRPAGVTLTGRPADLEFDPPQLSMAISQACWRLLSRCGDTTEIVIRGRDALRWERIRNKQPGATVLHGPRGGTLRVRLEDPENRAGTVVAKVTAENLGMAGTYSGTLPVDASAPGGPVLELDAKVRWSLGSAIAAVFAGALLGGFFLRRFEIRLRRRLLELELVAAVRRYDDERLQQPRVYSFDLDALLEPRRENAEPYPGTRGLSALLWHIRHATDDEDFAQDIERTHALIATIEHWLALEPVARDAAKLLEDAQPELRKRPDGRGEIAFSECQSYRDLARLRIRATTAPVDDVECQTLIERLIAQCLVVSKAKVIWALLSALERRNGISVEAGRTMHELDLIALEDRFPPLLDRAPEQTEELRLVLEDAEAKLLRLHAEVAEAVTGSAAAEQAQRIADTMSDKRGRTAIDRQLPELPVGLRRVRSAVDRLALRSVLWTLARALVAVAAYTLLIYDDTWGTETDFASAFTAGFLTETLVNWAVLPAFRSIRSRSTPSPSPAQTDPLVLHGSPGTPESLVQGTAR